MFKSFFIVSVLFATLAAGVNIGGARWREQPRLAAAEIRAGVTSLRNDWPKVKGTAEDSGSIPRKIWRQIGSDMEMLAADARSDAQRAKQLLKDYGAS